MSDTLSNDDWEKLGEVPGFKLLELIGSSWSCNVYRAIRLADDRPVAIKIFAESFHSDSALKRFDHELRVARLLKNAHRIELLLVTQTTQRLPALCMELIEGQILSSLQRTGHAFSQPEVIVVMLQVCEYLVELHELGFVHGDIKPANLMRAESEQLQIKVLDLGTSREINDRSRNVASDAEDSQQVVSGSPSYMAPELILAPLKCNPSSDIYALGCSAYELIAGTPPFIGNNVLQILLKHRNQVPAKLDASKVDDRLSRLIMSCLEKKVQNRPESAAELLDALRRL